MDDSWGPPSPKWCLDSDGDPIWSWELLGNKFYLGPVSNYVFGGLSCPIELGPPQKVESPNVTKAGLANDAAPLSSLTGCNLASNLSKPTCFVWAAGVHVI